MSEVNDGFSGALGILGMLGRLVTVTFGNATAQAAFVQTGMPLSQGAAFVQKSQNSGYQLTMLATAFNAMPGKNDVLAIAEMGLSYSVLVAPPLITPLVTYELGAGFKPSA